MTESRLHMKNKGFTLIRKSCDREHAFTLIELLIVIAIIGTLAAIGLATFPGIQKSARDSKRKSDIKQYQTALEVFANKSNGFYPYFAPSVPGRGVCGGTITLFGVLGLTGDCVDDPSSASYRYYAIGGSGTAGGPTATGYLLYARLEKPADDGGVQYFVNCSEGTSGRIAESAWTPSSTCPDNLQP